MGSFGTVSIVAGVFVVIVYTVAALCAALELSVRPGAGYSRRRWSFTSALALVSGAGIGLLAAWVATGVFDLFGVDFSLGGLIWLSLGFAFIALCVCSFFGSRWPRK